MEKGYNSDISIKGENYHIQTEDWGKNNPFVVSKIFCNGAVIKTVKTPYLGQTSSGIIRQTLKEQHTKILDLLVSGQLRLHSLK